MSTPRQGRSQVYLDRKLQNISLDGKFQDTRYKQISNFKHQTRVVAQFRSGHGPIPVLFECYRIRTDSGMPRLDIRFSTSHLMMASTR